MPGPAVAAIAAVGTIGQGLIGASAAKKAGKAQAQAAEASAAEQRAAREEMRRLLQPYVDAGQPALQNMMALAGLAPTQTNWTGYAQANPELMAAYQAQQQTPQVTIGQDGRPQFIRSAFLGYDGPTGMSGGGNSPMSLEQFAQQWHAQRGGDISQFQQTGEQQQQAAVSAIENNPLFQSQVRQGEEAMLQNASATGGLRGGNVQGALAQFRPAMLQDAIQQQYARLAGITQLGQSSAAGVGAAGIDVAGNIGTALTQAGAARAGSALGQGQAWGNMLGGLTSIASGAMGGPRPVGGAF